MPRPPEHREKALTFMRPGADSGTRRGHANWLKETLSGLVVRPCRRPRLDHVVTRLGIPGIERTSVAAKVGPLDRAFRSGCRRRVSRPEPA